MKRTFKQRKSGRISERSTRTTLIQQALQDGVQLKMPQKSPAKRVIMLDSEDDSSEETNQMPADDIRAYFKGNTVKKKANVCLDSDDEVDIDVEQRQPKAILSDSSDSDTSDNEFVVSDNDSMSSGDPNIDYKIDADEVRRQITRPPQLRDLQQCFTVYLELFMANYFDSELFFNLEQLDNFEREVGPAIDRIDRLVDTLLSKMASNAWSSSFKKALDTYPTIESYSISSNEAICQACQRTDRKVSLKVLFSGSPYDHRSLALLEFEVDDDDAVQTGHRKRKRAKRHGAEKPPDRFKVGRFCGERAQIYHDLRHWKISVRSDCFRKVDTEIARLRSDGHDADSDCSDSADELPASAEAADFSDAQVEKVVRCCIADADWVQMQYRFFKTIMDTCSGYKDAYHRALTDEPLEGFGSP